MVIFKAEVIDRDAEQYLMLHIQGVELNIPLTKDEPNEVKMVFNRLILQLKKERFKFEIAEKVDGDIFYNIAREYINQLNSELEVIHKELEAHSLLDAPTENTID